MQIAINSTIERLECFQECIGLISCRSPLTSAEIQLNLAAKECFMFKSFYKETERLVLTNFNKDDAESFYRILCQDEILKYLPEEKMTEREVEELVDWFILCYSTNKKDDIRKFTVVVRLKKSNELIGWTGLGPLDFDESEIELYFGISKDHWNRGYGTEASKKILEFGLNEVELEKIVAVVKSQNKPSIRVIEKLGMKYSKTLNGLAKEFDFYNGALYYFKNK